MVLQDGMRLNDRKAAGALGAIGAFRVLQSRFAVLQPVDLRSVVGAAALLLALMLAAAGLPVRRAHPTQSGRRTSIGLRPAPHTPPQRCGASSRGRRELWS